MSPIAIQGVTHGGPGLAPSLVQPTDALYEDLSTPPTFEWNYNGGLTQLAWGLRRKYGGALAYRYWNATTGIWQSTPYYKNTAGSSDADSVGNPDSPGTTQWSYTFPAGAWGNGPTFAWSVASLDTNGISPWSPDNSVTGQGAPTVTAIAVSAGTAYPIVSWTPVTAPGAAQLGYQVVIYDSTQYGAGGFAPGVGPNVWDSTQLAGQTTAVEVETPLPTGATSYRAYVQISESGGQVSAWAYLGFTVTYTAPTDPTMVLTPSDSANPSLLEPYVTLTLTDHNGSIAAWTTPQFIVTFSDDVGTTWWVLDDTPVPITAAGQVSTIVDRNGTPGFTRMYRVQVQGNVGAAVKASAQVTGSQAHPNPLNWWLKDPSNHTLNMRLSLTDGPFERKSTDRQNVLSPVGRPDPVVLSDVPSLPIISATFQFLSDEDYQDYEQLRASRKTLLFQGPYPMGQWYIRFGPDTGVVTNLRSVRTATITGRDEVDSTVTVTMYVVAKP
jgi:hypothetical protein